MDQFRDECGPAFDKAGYWVRLPFGCGRKPRGANFGTDRECNIDQPRLARAADLPAAARAVFPGDFHRAAGTADARPPTARLVL